ncbi:uncharacterized protein LOC135844332 [Planococcus citri]|uniref:uncharacterized protein LOC135844332 n=1 Tax=Planococcus citri TaxID=170843 RepID=UPI0031F87995
MMRFYVAFFINVLLFNYVSAQYDALPILDYSYQDEPPQQDVSITAYACGAENEKQTTNLITASKNKKKETLRLPYCVFTRSADDSTGNSSTCPTEVKPIFVPTKNKKDKSLASDEEERNPFVSCGTSDTQIMHTFGFYRCGSRQILKEFHRREVRKDPSTKLDMKRSVTPFYKACYDTSTNETIWTKHSVTTPVVFDRVKIETKEPIKQEISVDPFGTWNAPFQILKEAYESEKLKDPAKHDIMLPQPLVPPEHFAFYVWKKTTNHILNMAPLWEKLVPVMSIVNRSLQEAQMRLYFWKPLEYSKLIIYTKVESIATANETPDNPEGDEIKAGSVPSPTNDAPIGSHGSDMKKENVPMSQESDIRMDSVPMSQGSDYMMDSVPMSQGSDYKMGTAPMSQGSDYKMDSVPMSQGSEYKTESSVPITDAPIESQDSVFIDSLSTQGTLTQPEEPQLEPPRLNPNIWCKFIYDENEREGLLIYIHNTPPNTPQIAPKCAEPVVCEFNKWPGGKENPDESVIENARKYAYCCPANSDVVKEIFSIDVKIEGTLDLNSTITKLIGKRRRSNSKKLKMSSSIGGSSSKKGEAKEKKKKTSDVNDP